MSLTAFKPEPASGIELSQARQCLGADPETLLSIFEPDVNLAVWQRSLPPSLQCYISCLQSTLQLPPQYMLTVSDISSELSAQLPESPGKTEFIADIQQIAEMFACLMDCQQLGLRLRVLDKPMCPKFHTDHLVCRLVSSYSGPATEWHAGPVTAAKPTQQLQCGDIALLKGSGWEDSPCHAISHRSPATPGQRLLLTLDPVW